MMPNKPTGQPSDTQQKQATPPPVGAPVTTATKTVQPTKAAGLTPPPADTQAAMNKLNEMTEKANQEKAAPKKSAPSKEEVPADFLRALVKGLLMIQKGMKEGTIQKTPVGRLVDYIKDKIAGKKDTAQNAATVNVDEQSVLAKQQAAKQATIAQGAMAQGAATQGEIETSEEDLRAANTEKAAQSASPQSQELDLAGKKLEALSQKLQEANITPEEAKEAIAGISDAAQTMQSVGLSEEQAQVVGKAVESAHLYGQNLDKAAEVAAKPAAEVVQTVEKDVGQGMKPN